MIFGKKKKKVVIKKVKKKPEKIETKKVNPKVAFGSSKDVEDYYKTEREKVNNYLKDLEKERVKSHLDVSRDKLIGLKASRKKIELMHHDLDNQVKKINDSIKDLQKKKAGSEEGKAAIYKLKDSISSMDDEARSIMETRRERVQKVKKLIMNMKKVADDAGKDMDVMEFE